jgi:hypothetical protein
VLARSLAQQHDFGAPAVVQITLVAMLGLTLRAPCVNASMFRSPSAP